MAQLTICPHCQKAFKNDAKEQDSRSGEAASKPRTVITAPTAPRKDDFTSPPPGRNGPDPFY
jgi:hypothetical protein